MKRRLDLALALAHRPRILFLDEPTTGLDIQSRTALWEEVARPRRDDGVTVFLTTQYLEEADALADRVGIIDHGKIVAEGTPAALKAEIGRPTVEAVPRDPAEHERTGRGPRPLRRARRRLAERRRGAPRRRRVGAGRGGPRARRRGDRDRAPAAARALARRRLPGQDRALAGGRRGGRGRGRGRGRRGGRARRERRPPHPGRAARPPLGPAHPAPAGPDRAGADLPALPAGGELGWAQRRDQPARLPDRLLPHLRPRRALHAGGAVLGDERRHRPRPRHRDRLPQPPRADPAARRRPAQRPARRRRPARAACRRSPT